MFSPFQLRDLPLSNRIVVSPMAQFSAVEGCATDWHLMHLGNLSVSGAGLMITEAVAVDIDGRCTPGDLGIWSDKQAASLEPIGSFCRKHGGARLGMQLYHAGRKGSVTSPWERQQYIPIERNGWMTSGASDIPYPERGHPVALDRDGIAAVIKSFVSAAHRANDLGYDLLELHAAHGYLLHNFLSPLTNTRDDIYGVNLAGRMRLVIEIFSAIRDVWPERKPLGVRISASDWADGGWDIDSSVDLATALRSNGCDYICASSGGAVREQVLDVYPGYQVPFAERIRREANIPTMAVGLITDPHQANDILAGQQADLIALGRIMLYNPRWPWHAAIELGKEFSCPPQYLRSHPEMRSGDPLRAQRAP